MIWLLLVVFSITSLRQLKLTLIFGVLLFSSLTLKQIDMYYEYNKYEFKLGYVAEEKIGSGKYSEVYRGIDLYTQSTIVIKFLKPIKHLKIQREVKLIKDLSGHPNIIELLDITQDPDEQTYNLIFPYIDNTPSKGYKSFTYEDVKIYMKQILEALSYIHSKGIVHRDLKPKNIMIDNEAKKAMIIDWGLGEYYLYGNDLNTRVATKQYKSPELLVNDTTYGYPLDVWSLGVWFAGTTFNKLPFWDAETNDDMMEEICKVLGSTPLVKWLEKYNLTLTPKQYQVVKRHRTKDFRKWMTEENKHMVTDEALDLLKRMLVYDPEDRITVDQALDHPYFYTK